MLRFAKQKQTAVLAGILLAVCGLCVANYVFSLRLFGGYDKYALIVAGLIAFASLFVFANRIEEVSTTKKGPDEASEATVMRRNRSDWRVFVFGFSVAITTAPLILWVANDLKGGWIGLLRYEILSWLLGLVVFAGLRKRRVKVLE